MSEFNPNQQPQYQQPQYQAPVQTAPSMQLPANRGLVKAILLSIITFGIYGIVLMYKLTEEINLTTSKYDGKKTMNYLLMALIVAPLTLGIYGIVWQHGFCNRIGSALKMRGIDYKFGAGTFWGWGVLGTFIVVGPFVFLHKMIKAMNLINQDYNTRG